MNLPKFLIAESNETEDVLYVLHTEYPRFVMNPETQEIEWFDELEKMEESELNNLIHNLLELSLEFFENEMKVYLDLEEDKI